jgi:hypothetical protein
MMVRLYSIKSTPSSGSNGKAAVGSNAIATGTLL